MIGASSGPHVILAAPAISSAAIRWAGLRDVDSRAGSAALLVRPSAELRPDAGRIAWTRGPRGGWALRCGEAEGASLASACFALQRDAGRIKPRADGCDWETAAEAAEESRSC